MKTLFYLILSGLLVFGSVYYWYNHYMSIQNLEGLEEKLFSSLPESEKQDVVWALEALKSKCYPLFHQYADDIEHIEASVYSDDWCKGDYKCEDYGWKDTISFRISLNDSLLSIPNEFRAWGHTLHYDISENGKAGIISQKAQSQLACGWKPNSDGSDVFIPIN